jgi:hypothetical protein
MATTETQESYYYKRVPGAATCGHAHRTVDAAERCRGPRVYAGAANATREVVHRRTLSDQHLLGGCDECGEA